MSGPRRRGGGWGWLVFMAIPPLIVVAGLVTLFVWQGAKGGVRGKWQKAPPRPATATPASTNTTNTTKAKTNAAPVRP